jgi:hypothetical protein
MISSLCGFCTLHAKEDDMGGECSMHRGNEKCVQNFAWEA